MSNKSKTKKELIKEVELLHKRVTQFEEVDSEKKRIEEALRENEERYRQLIELSFDAIAVHSEGKVVFVNSAAVKLLGAATPEELVGKPIMDFVHPDYREIVRERIGQMTEESIEVPLIEEKFIRVDGTSVDIEVAAMPLKYQGKPAVQVVIRDITTRIRAEEEIEKRQKYLESVLRDAPDAIVTLDASQRILEWNPRAEQIFGYTRNEVLGKNIDDLITNPDVSKEAVALTKQVLSGEEVLPRETIRYRKDGTPVDVIVAGSPIMVGGELHGVVAVYTDITERKNAEVALHQSEEKYRTIVETSHDLIWSTDLKGIFTFINQRGEELTGHDIERIIGTDSADMIHPDDLPTAREHFLKVIHEGEVQTCELRIKGKTGRYVTLLVTEVPIFKNDIIVGVMAFGLDITDRKGAEEALRKSEEKLQTWVETTKDGFFVMSPTGFYEYMNENCAAIGGYRPDELIGKHMSKVITTKDLPKALRILKQLLAKKEISTFELNLKRKDKTIVPVEFNVSFITNKKGKVQQVLGIARDITERLSAEQTGKQAEETIKAWQERYEKVVAATGEAIYEWDIQTDRTVWSGSIKNVLGYTQDEFIRIEDAWETCIHPDDFKESSRIIQEAIEGSTSSVTLEYRFRHKNGSYRHILDRCIIIRDEKKKAIKSLGAMTDITTQKEAENAASEAQRLQNVLYRIADTTSTARDLADLFRAIHSYLSTVIDTTNFYIAFYDAEKDLVSFPYFMDEMDTPPTASMPIGRGLTAYLLRRGKSLYLTKGEMKELARRGEIEIVGTLSEVWLGIPLKVENQSVGAVVVQSYEDRNLYSEKDLEILEFVSDQIANAIVHKQAEEAVQRSEEKYRTLSKELTEANNMKELLLDVITHDLKNPAGVISGMTEIMAEKNPEDEIVHLVKNSSDNLLKVIENTTTMARITLHEEIEKEELNLAEVIEQVSSEFSPSLKSNGMTLENHISEALPVLANPIIAEVFSNYISNAIKYSADGKRIVIDAEESNDFVTIAVSDFGRSVPKKDHLRIFDRTIQLDSDAKSGRGLGLAIVKRIAEAHNGEVWVSEGTVGEANRKVPSDKSKGNIFYLKIPRK